ncbi:hypothetical protein U9M48_011400 [Paspalum notatum var. saurae]|uniref:Rx N-terminal domain-containing protein n=1 Tax=Paspalum notatum var. saurae TaxID=547442 RepID=A0AAQ3WHH5_PASNO
METVISVIVGELATRSLSFLINRYFKPAPSKEDSIQKLQWMLLRVRLTVKEAEGRRITNQAMLQQLNILRAVMYRGYYMLDTFIQQVPEEEDGKDHGVSRFLSLSKFSPAKRVCFSAARKYGAEKLEEMLESLEMAITSMTEFVIFLRNYPPMFCQPYSTYLFMEKCIFGRQLEMKRVISFLLHEDPPRDCSFGVLPIVGPGKVGKTTLVEHVCCDERVRNHFSHTIFLRASMRGETGRGRRDGGSKAAPSERARPRRGQAKLCVPNVHRIDVRERGRVLKDVLETAQGPTPWEEAKGCGSGTSEGTEWLRPRRSRGGVQPWESRAPLPPLFQPFTNRGRAGRRKPRHWHLAGKDELAASWGRRATPTSGRGVRRA